MRQVRKVVWIQSCHLSSIGGKILIPYGVTQPVDGHITGFAWRVRCTGRNSHKPDKDTGDLLFWSSNCLEFTHTHVYIGLVKYLFNTVSFLRSRDVHWAGNLNHNTINCKDWYFNENNNNNHINQHYVVFKFVIVWMNWTVDAVVTIGCGRMIIGPTIQIEQH